MEIAIRGKAYKLDGLLPLKWGDLKDARKAGLMKSGADQDVSNDEMLLYVLRRVCPEATPEDVNNLPLGLASQILAEALGIATPPFGNSSTPAMR